MDNPPAGCMAHLARVARRVEKERFIMTKKWLTLCTLLFGGATVLSGCMGEFWSGFWNTGWPTNSRWINIGIDVLNEELIG